MHTKTQEPQQEEIQASKSSRVLLLRYVKLSQENLRWRFQLKNDCIYNRFGLFVVPFRQLTFPAIILFNRERTF